MKALILPFFLLLWLDVSSASTCSEVLTSSEHSEVSEKKLLMCQLHESAVLVAQLGDLVANGMTGLMNSAGVEPDADIEQMIHKRKHEYLRFGKRKHEYLRFGKRKHEYLRFGKRKHEYLRFGRK